tara:strand:- start:463 stop:645 length:183 start_codon:yes stop_codon:yes gene_type:complete
MWLEPAGCWTENQLVAVQTKKVLEHSSFQFFCKAAIILGRAAEWYLQDEQGKDTRRLIIA